MKQLSLFESQPRRSDYWVGHLTPLLAANGFDGSEESARKIFKQTSFPLLYMAMFRSQREYIIKEIESDASNTK